MDMGADGNEAPGTGQGLSRRRVLAGAGLAAAAVPLTAKGASAASLLKTAGAASAPSPDGLHVQFGADASKQAAVSWLSPVQVRRPRLRIGTPHHGYGSTVAAEERAYTEALTGQTVFTYHAHLDHLAPDTSYIYEAFNDGGAPVSASFKTAPRGRSRAFRFTSFGDQAVPMKIGRGLGPWTANAGFIVSAVEALDPLFHLFNGDLCYANISDDPVATWTAFFENDQRSAANRPWMPSAGNHENEVGNGPQGYLSYQTRFTLPDNGSRSFTSRAAPARSPSPTTARSSTRPTTLRSTPSRCASPSAATTPGTAAVEPGSGG
jgi:hypothetical protein